MGWIKRVNEMRKLLCKKYPDIFTCLKHQKKPRIILDKRKGTFCVDCKRNRDTAQACWERLKSARNIMCNYFIGTAKNVKKNKRVNSNRTITHAHLLNEGAMKKVKSWVGAFKRGNLTLE